MPVTFDLILKNGNCFIEGQLKTVDIAISSGMPQFSHSGLFCFLTQSTGQFLNNAIPDISQLV